MTPFHCSNCNKLLGMIDGKAEIKCPRCKTMNVKTLNINIKVTNATLLYRSGAITHDEFIEAFGIPELCNKPAIE